MNQMTDIKITRMVKTVTRMVTMVRIFSKMGRMVWILTWILRIVSRMVKICTLLVRIVNRMVRIVN